ncbi:ABC transporter ATP-binding protein [Microbacterium rhizosphaerae]|uniref:ABC transporter ATP-binding protein n=1 Tax=Microbacterium rhizosphaerae TaxID=1678237 RepID=A0ABZ0SK52_9MICO|nr:ABC transporter ATP-binding protein [Microbacterium rhizosphaerae]WPR88611.1 ABC transporter ATP-binding protein [Microbacterium rhizosphaerae]
MDPVPPIVTQDLAKRYRHSLALDGVSLTLEPGEVFGYLGPNGAGKTTTIRLLMGMLRPSSGRAVVCGLDAWSEARDVHRVVGYVPGEPSVYTRLTGAQHIDYICHLRGRKDHARAVQVAERLSLDLTRRAGVLSRGNRQKLALVLAVMSRPALLILDEPTSGLDPLVQHEVHSLLREHAQDGGSVFLSSHVLGEVQRVATRIGVLRQGKLIAVERLDELSARSLHRVRATFATPVSVEDFAGISGVTNLVAIGERMRCEAPQSALDALLKRISAHPVVDFECAESDLEDMFMTYYGGDHDAEHRVHEVAV